MGLSTSSPVDMDGPLAQEIRKTVAENKVVLYSKTYCPYCTEAKKIFHNLNSTYQTIELDRHTDGRMMQNILTEMTGAHTVPRVFINGKCVGGCSETKSLYKSGKLEVMLNENS